MERQLARIEQVAKLTPIEGADRIEIAHIRGWQCVVKNGEFQPGDLGVYFEIDSFLPIDSRYEFLRPSCFKKMLDLEGFRLKTAKFRGQISQGLILPLSAFPEIPAPEPGMDVTELLGIVKYEPPIPTHLAGEIKGLFPSFIPKSDQERIQNLPELFERCRGDRFEVTIKMDGTSMTAYWRSRGPGQEGEFGVCSRNLELKRNPDNSLWRMALSLGIEQRLAAYGRNLALQGELCGEGIQKNHDRLRGHRWFIFDVFDIDARRYLWRDERIEVLDALGATAQPALDQAPFLGFEKVFEQYPDIDSMLAFADGPGFNSPVREGVVCKAVEPTHGTPLSFKVINNRYLLKHEV